MSKKTITLGKLRSLQRASTANDVFTIVAIDHIDAIRRLMPDRTDEQVSLCKQQAVEAFASYLSGMLLDPVLGAAQVIARGLLRGTGLLIELERADYGEEPVPLDLEIRAGWCVEQIKRMGADGVKLFYYYNPDYPVHAASQEALIQPVIADCARYDIPLYAEPILYDASGPAVERLVIASAERFAALGADILKLEFPIDIRAFPDETEWTRACEALTSRLDAPWVLLSAGVDFETFARQVRVACQGGASGFIAGRSVWGEAAAIADPATRAGWLSGEGARRLETLSETAERYARPWSQVLTATPVDATWYHAY